VNSMNGFQLENTTTSYGLLKIDNANNMSLSLFSADNINFKMNDNNTGCFSPANSLCVNAGMVVNANGTFNYETNNNLNIQNNSIINGAYLNKQNDIGTKDLNALHLIVQKHTISYCAC